MSYRDAAKEALNTSSHPQPCAPHIFCVYHIKAVSKGGVGDDQRLCATQPFGLDDLHELGSASPKIPG